MRKINWEELINTITHGIGLILSIVGAVFLILFSFRYGELHHIAALSIYGGCLIALYTSSTVMHAFLTGGKDLLPLEQLDHIAIYLLIAGTYTPFTLLAMDGDLGLTMLWIVWIIAGLGIVYKLFFFHKFVFLSNFSYLAMGWLIVVALKPLKSTLPSPAMWLLFAGGLAYSIGTIFFVWRKLKFSHAIWHIFVVAGSACHYAAMWYLIPFPSEAG